MLSVQNLSHKYGVTKVLSELSFNVSAGETLAIVGPSGCGKSTLLQALAGLITPSSGQIQCQANPISYVFQEPRLLPWKNSRDNLTLGLLAQSYPKTERWQLAENMARQLGLSLEDLHKYPHELSGGMQSRIALGRALLLSPQLLLLDEPFSALDIGLKLELYALLRQFVQQKHSSVIMITHDLMEAVRLADRILVLGGKPGGILAQYSLNQAQETRSDSWIYQECAELMQHPPVRVSFGLK